MQTVVSTVRNISLQLAGRMRSADLERFAIRCFALLCLGAVVFFFTYPTYPNYDSYYSLLWGKELLAGDHLSFEAYRAPTQHPIAIVVGALLSLLGTGADRVLVLLTIVSFLALIWGFYRLARTAYTPLIGLLAAFLLLSRLDFPFLAARAYIDVPYLAVVIWAAVLEAERPRRGTSVFVLLAFAGTMRPEAWVLAGLYWLWVAWRVGWGPRIRYAALVTIAPLIWMGTDLAVTGNPLFSFQSTSGLAEELDRQRTASDIPAALRHFFIATVKYPVAVAGTFGLAAALWLTPKRSAMPLALLVSGVGVFVLIGLGGLSVIQRYLVVASLALMIFAAFALGGWETLKQGSVLRRVWFWLAVLGVAYGLFVTVTRIDLNRLDADLGFREESHKSLVKLLSTPAVKQGLRCGPISLPNHKLIPEVRWVLDLPEDRVIARSDPASSAKANSGVAVFVTGRAALLRQIFVQGAVDDPLLQVPAAGFERKATSTYYSAYVRC